MARLLGIDIGQEHIRAVLLRTGIRSMKVEQLVEADMRSFRLAQSYATEGVTEDAGPVSGILHSTIRPLALHGEAIAVSLPGDKVFFHEVSIPASARRQLAEVLPFELEALVPVDFDELVHAHRVMPAEPTREGAPEMIRVLAGAARLADVKQRIVDVKAALKREPERVGCGALPLANLQAIAPELRTDTPTAVVEIGERSTDLVVLQGGEPRLARTLSRGYAHLPEHAQGLALELKQSLLGYAVKRGARVEKIHLVGLGAGDQSAPSYLAQFIDAPIYPMPTLELDGIEAGDLPRLPRFAKAIGLALSLRSRPMDIDLRTGPAAFQRGFGFVKQKAPVLAGLAGALMVSYLFSAWAESRALAAEDEMLTQALGALSKEVLGQEVSDPDVARGKLERLRKDKLTDPRPRFDGFDLIDELSKAVPKTLTHDVNELDLKGTKARITGLVDTKADAQKVATALKKVSCVEEAKIAKISQVIRSDKQKYELDLELPCLVVESGAKKKKKKSKKKEDGK